MLLVIDNYDSFTYNIVHYLRELGANVLVKQNDQISIEKCLALKPSHCLISPGPCTPDQSGISMPLIKALYKHIPVLGVCLGHQAIAQCFGATIKHATRIMHGKLSSITHSGDQLFNEIPSEYKVTRYHSLQVMANSLPEELVATAWSNDANEPNVIMALRHRDYPLFGVQFHPEAILTEHGHKLLYNFLQQGDY